MDDTSRWELLAKYFSGQASDRDVEKLEEWIGSDPTRRELFDEAADAWSLTEDRRSLDIDVSDAWDTVWDGMYGGAEPRAYEPRASREQRTRRASMDRSRRPWGRLLHVAGALALLLIPVLVIALLKGPTAQTMATNRGERSSFKLADGTHVHLNADSKLTLSPGFNQGPREVQLEGEAYFDVPSMNDRPFHVHTSEGTVHVVGTAFNVHAYADEDEAQVVVANGRVALQARTSAPAARLDTVILEPRELGVLAGQHARLLRRDVDLHPFTDWKEGRLVFEKAPFAEVVRRLERWYNLQIDVQAPRSAIDQLNAVFEGESVRDVISDIAIALDLQYRIDGRQVTFWRRSSTVPPHSAEKEASNDNDSELNAVDH
jgi:ferric-dicitrate binding protein FerR (iron transport regulator)